MSGASGANRNPTRAKARKRAIDILFEADLRGVDPTTILQARVAAADPPVRDFTAQLVRGVAAQPDLDQRIAAQLRGGWTLARLPRVDRVALRLAAYELAAGETPASVVIAEAVRLAAELSTDSSAGFVNGVLAKLAGKLADVTDIADAEAEVLDNLAEDR